MEPKTRVGLFGIGLDAYWPQFEGLSVEETADGRLMLLTAEGERVPGPILEIGNTNSRYKFIIGARRFVNEWNKHSPAHHCAIGVGHIYNKLEKLVSILEMPIVRVC